MPSPIAHSATGYVLSKLLPLNNSQGRSLGKIKLGLALLVANLADMDFIGQLLDLASHRGLTHSLVFMGGVSGVCGLFAIRWGRPVAQQLLLFVLAIYGSHLALDCITAGGPGMQLLWPFSHAFYGAPVRIFPAVHHEQGIFYSGHVKFICFELLYGLLIIMPVWIWKKLISNRRTKVV